MADIKVFVGSVFGGASEVAEQVISALQTDGHQAQLCSPPTLAQFQQAEAILIITSTTGQGDIPENLENFYLQLQAQFPLISDIPFGVIAIGDSGYSDTFCQGGALMYALLEELQGKAIQAMLQIDACETLEPEIIAVAWAKQWAQLLYSKPGV